MNIKELKLRLEAEGANDDHAHELLADIANDTVAAIIDIETVNREQWNELVEAYFKGFCRAEGFTVKKEVENA